MGSLHEVIRYHDYELYASSGIYRNGVVSEVVCRHEATAHINSLPVSGMRDWELPSLHVGEEVQ